MTTRQSTRRAEETLGVLAGDTPNRGARAVRWSDMEAYVPKALASALGLLGAADKIAPLLSSFRYGDLAAGIYSWALGKTTYPPPYGRGGGGLYLPRTAGRVGTWIAATAAGASGDNAPRLFASSTSGTPNDWSRWFEILNMAMLLRPVRFDQGFPAGGVMEVVQNANGRAMRFASGMQICARTDLPTLTRASADTLTAAWTYPAAFMEPPVASLFLPAPGAGYVDVTAVEVGGTYSTVGSGAAVTLGARRCYGAPGFAGTAAVSGAKAVAIGMWGQP